jgi:hypothetical protein
MGFGGNVQRAKTEVKRCPMSEDICADRVIAQIQGFYTTGEGAVNARKVVEEACGRYVKGKNAGKLRGWANIWICVEGGWKTEGPGERNGFVMYPGKVYGISITDFNGNVYYAAGLPVPGYSHVR